MMVLLKRTLAYSLYLLNQYSLHLLKFSSIIFFTKFHKNKLNSIISNIPGKDIIVFYSSHNWSYPMMQRFPQLAKEFGKKGYLVFYCSDYPEKNVVTGFYPVFQNCYLSFRLDLIQTLSQKILIFFPSYDIKTCYKKIYEHLDKGDSVIYDYLDEIHEDINQETITEDMLTKHKNILRDERIFVTATAGKLFDEAAKYRSKNFALVTNGVDIAHFSEKTSENALIPRKMKKIMKMNSPVIGYYGTIAIRLDFDLLLNLARERPQYEIVLIGLIGDNTIYNYDFSSLSNFHILKQVNYNDLPDYSRLFDVAMIPFRINDVTNSTSPIKLFEYMASGLPVVSTGIPECRKYKPVLIGKDYNDFILKVDEAIHLKKDKDYQSLLKTAAAKNSWESKVEEIIRFPNFNS